MTTVIGLFNDEAHALAVVETLRSARFDTDALRLVGGTQTIAEFVTQAGSSANVAAGPTNSVLRSLVPSDLSEHELTTMEQHVEAGHVLLLAKGLGDEAAEQLDAKLRENHAERVINRAQP
jgi:hypothetical protein